MTRSRTPARDPRRWISVFVALMVVLVVVLPDRGSVFCHMVERVMASCCCATMATAHDAGGPLHDHDVAERPCCEWRRGKALPTASTPPPDKALTAPPSPATVATAPKMDHQRPRLVRIACAMVHSRTPVSVRASPVRRGKLRAHLGVMLC